MTPVTVEKLTNQLQPQDWTRCVLRDGTRGPLRVDVACRRVWVMRGIARDFAVPRDMRTSEALWPFSSAATAPAEAKTENKDSGVASVQTIGVSHAQPTI